MRYDAKSARTQQEMGFFFFSGELFTQKQRIEKIVERLTLNRNTNRNNNIRSFVYKQ